MMIMMIQDSTYRTEEEEEEEDWMFNEAVTTATSTYDRSRHGKRKKEEGERGEIKVVG